MAESKDRRWNQVPRGLFSDHPEARRELVEFFLNELLRAKQAEYPQAILLRADVGADGLLALHAR